MTNKNVKTILIAGANGNLGRAIINVLENDLNNRIIAVSREEIPNILRLSLVTYCTYQDLFSEEFTNKNIDIIINCAYPKRDNANLNILEQTQQLAQRLMREANERWNSKLYINMSCHSVYGENRETLVNEDTVINIENLDEYARSKRTIEDSLENSSLDKIKLINLRLADIIDENYPIPVLDNMISTALNTGVVTPINTNNRYMYIHIIDVANAVNRIINTDLNLFDRTIYNLGSAFTRQSINGTQINTITTQNMAEILRNSDTVSFFRPVTIENAINDEKNGTIRYAMDSMRLFNILQWQPEFTMPTSIEEKVISISADLNW